MQAAIILKRSRLFASRFKRGVRSMVAGLIPILEMKLKRGRDRDQEWEL
jgi:hypothetical protein